MKEGLIGWFVDGYCCTRACRIGEGSAKRPWWRRGHDSPINYKPGGYTTIDISLFIDQNTSNIPKPFDSLHYTTAQGDVRCCLLIGSCLYDQAHSFARLDRPWCSAPCVWFLPSLTLLIIIVHIIYDLYIFNNNPVLNKWFVFKTLSIS